MAKTGAFLLILHAHLPYIHQPEGLAFGQRRLHLLLVETFLPLLEILHEIDAEDIPATLTLSITPLLAEQLARQSLMDQVDDYLAARIKAAQHDRVHFASPNITDINGKDHIPYLREVDPHLESLADWYVSYFTRLRATFNKTFQRDLVATMRRLRDTGRLELITSAATHAYLPLLQTEESLHAQLSIACETHERIFGQQPQGIWLPGLGYRPACKTADGHRLPSIAALLDKFKFDAFLTETHLITGGPPQGVAAGDVISHSYSVRHRYRVPTHTDTTPRREQTTFQPYTVALENGETSRVAVLGRDLDTGNQVWSDQIGYPDDFDYRERNKRAGTSGLRYWRVTGDRVQLANKDAYHIDWAEYKIEQHAEHFAHKVGDLLRKHQQTTGQYGVIPAAYSAELFGGWWFEGTRWIGKVLRHLARNDQIEMPGMVATVHEHPPQASVTLAEGSWGTGGHHFEWHNGDTSWIWEAVQACEMRYRQALANHSEENAANDKVLLQAGRELLILQNGDWSHDITTQRSSSYAPSQFNQHLINFRQLLDSIDKDKADTVLADRLYAEQPIFPNLTLADFSG